MKVSLPTDPIDHFKNLVSQKETSELIKIAYQPAEWSSEMIAAVDEELVLRNAFPLDVAEKRKLLMEQEHKRLEAVKDGSTIGLVIGWITVFGFGGLIIGYNYKNARTTSKYTGKTYYTYSAKRRNEGDTLFLVSCLGFIIALFYSVYRAFN